MNERIPFARGRIFVVVTGHPSRPHVAIEAEIVWRFHFMLGATSYAIAGTDALRVVTDWQIEEADATDRLDRLVPRLMSFLLGGLRAPLPQFSDAEAVGK